MYLYACVGFIFGLECFICAMVFSFVGVVLFDMCLLLNCMSVGLSMPTLIDLFIAAPEPGSGMLDEGAGSWIRQENADRVRWIG